MMRACLAALLAGATLPLAYAPMGVFPLAALCVAILFVLWQDAAPRRAFWLGYLFGVGCFAVGTSWVAVSMYRFSAMGMPVSAVLTLLFILVLSIYPALVGWLSRRYFSVAGKAVQLTLVVPALWVLTEWVRGWLFTGFPWLALGYSQTDSPLSGAAPLLGVYGVSWLVALSAGLLVLAWRLPARRGACLIGVALLWLATGGLARVEWSAPAGGMLTASLIQGNVPQNLKWRPDQRQPTIELYTHLSREHWADSDVVIWPETALPAYYHQAANFLRGLASEARARGSSLLLGLPVMDEAADGYYNAVVAVGDRPRFYFKSHLVPFGEYIPLRSLLGGLLDILQVPMADFSRGETGQPLLEVAGHKAAISICYEDAFGEEVIRGLPQASLLVNVSNDAWFGDSLAPHQHLQMARMRTIETARPMLRATNNGISAVIDHHGRVTAASPQFEVFVLRGGVQPRSGATPYVLAGNYPVLFLLLFSLLLAVYFQRRQHR